MKQQIIAVFLATGLFAAAPGLAADLQAGRELAAQTCATCHGPDGRNPVAPTYPVLAGQYRDYLLRTLRDYRSGARDNAVMQGMVSGLSDRDMENLAAWYSSREGLEVLGMD